MRKEEKALFIPDAQVSILLWRSALVCLGTLQLPCKIQRSTVFDSIINYLLTVLFYLISLPKPHILLWVHFSKLFTQLKSNYIIFFCLSIPPLPFASISLLFPISFCQWKGEKTENKTCGYLSPGLRWIPTVCWTISVSSITRDQIKYGIPGNHIRNYLSE